MTLFLAMQIDHWLQQERLPQKVHIQQRQDARSLELMRRNGFVTKHSRHVLDQTSRAIEHRDAYCAAHPRSPTARRRPRLLLRGELWVALLGPNIEKGIVGIGPTIEAALRAFDSQYLAAMPVSRHATTHRTFARSASVD
ncbi:MAG: hypothetical protein ABR514_10800 [Chthoniobacterales bacterium]